jgi:hypothetical protein
VSELIVEIHVPLVRDPNVGPREYPFPWIDDVNDFLAGLDGSAGQEYDDGEEDGDEYLFFVSSAPEAQLIELARQVARLPRVPAGVYATVNTDDGDMGTGRRVDLSL